MLARAWSGVSLRRQLLLWLLLPQLVLWAGGGLLAYRMALSYAEKGIDQSLTQSVRALARQVKPIGSGLLIDFPRAAQRHPEDAPHQPIALPDLDRMGRAQIMQRVVKAEQRRVDPGLGSVSTALDNGAKGGVCSNCESLAADDPGK